MLLLEPSPRSYLSPLLVRSPLPGSEPPTGSAVCSMACPVQWLQSQAFLWYQECPCLSFCSGFSLRIR